MMRVIAKVGWVSSADMQLDNTAKQKDNKRERNRKKNINGIMTGTPVCKIKFSHYEG